MTLMGGGGGAERAGADGGARGLKGMGPVEAALQLGRQRRPHCPEGIAFGERGSEGGVQGRLATALLLRAGGELGRYKAIGRSLRVERMQFFRDRGGCGRGGSGAPPPPPHPSQKSP